MFSVREEIEETVKSENLNRHNFFEVSKNSYQSIIKKIEDVFVDKSKNWEKDIHWSNANGYRPNLSVSYFRQEKVPFVDHLKEIIPNSEVFMYFMVEDTYKYYLYEGKIDEIVTVLNETSFYDFYIVSKKYDWLISENHHDGWSFIGEKLNLPEK